VATTTGSNFNDVLSSAFNAIGNIFGKKTNQLAVTPGSSVPVSTSTMFGSNTLVYVALGGGILLLFGVLMMRR